MIGTVLLKQGAVRARARTITITGATVTDNGDGSVTLAISGGGGGGLWTSSGYTGTANRIAGFDGSGAAGLVTLTSPLSLSGGAVSIDLSAYLTTATAAATYLTIATAASSYQPIDADLTALAALGDGLPVRSGGTWAANSLGDLAVSGGAMQATQARGLRESGGTTLTMATLADGELLRRVGTTVDGIVATETPTAGAVPIAGSGGTISADWIPGGLKPITMFSRFSTLIPLAGTALTNDGAGVLTTSGILPANVSGTNFPCVQIGDAGTATSRAYVTASWRTAEGTIYIDVMFRLGSDISTGNQYYFIGLTSQVTLNSSDPAGHRIMLRHVSGGASWYFTTKDGTTDNAQSTGIAVVASNYYRVQFVITATESTVRIGTDTTAQGAVDNFDINSPISSTTNLPTSTQDLIMDVSLVRSAGATTRGIQLNGMWMKSVPSWA